MLLDAKDVEYTELNDAVRRCGGECHIINCLGQRLIGSCLTGTKITIDSIPGNALGVYLNGGEIVVHGNAQDAVGDTMNEGRMVIHGNIGDAAGCAMRGGRIFVKGNANYRAGIHMKQHKAKVPVLVIGDRAVSFPGEYQAA